jgi:hypothetical protein
VLDTGGAARGLTPETPTAQTQGKNIRHYASYLTERAKSYRDTQTDWVRAPESRLEKVTVEKGLLREVESVQRQLAALLKCDVLDIGEPETEITITVFRLLVLDLLSLFQVLNQGLINILGEFLAFPQLLLALLVRAGLLTSHKSRPLLRNVKDGCRESHGYLQSVRTADRLCGRLPKPRQETRTPHPS